MATDGPNSPVVAISMRGTTIGKPPGSSTPSKSTTEVIWAQNNQIPASRTIRLAREGVAIRRRRSKLSAVQPSQDPDLERAHREGNWKAAESTESCTEQRGGCEDFGQLDE